jgi:hypothetical protein
MPLGFRCYAPVRLRDRHAFIVQPDQPVVEAIGNSRSESHHARRMAEQNARNCDG